MVVVAGARAVWDSCPKDFLTLECAVEPSVGRGVSTECPLGGPQLCLSASRGRCAGGGSAATVRRRRLGDTGSFGCLVGRLSVFE